MLKRNISMLIIAGALFGAQADLAMAHQAASMGRGSDPMSQVKLGHLGARDAGATYAAADTSYQCEESRMGTDCSESPFPPDNSQD